ncbi:MAG TPA: DUF3108 domain-containing protein [Gammaproteobacteria bacterium]
MPRFIYITALLLLCAPLQAEVDIQPFSADYTVQYNGFKVGEMSQRLVAQDDGTYLMETEAYATGIAAMFTKDRVIERSVWRYLDGTIRPISYHYYYAGGRKKEREERLDFDWEAMQVKSLYKGRRSQLPLGPDVYDQQLYQLVLRHQVANGKRKFHYKVAARGKLREYDFEVTGTDQVVTPFGKVNAVRLKKDDVDLWLAEDHNYLVVKLKKVDDDDEVTSYISAKSP